MGCVPHGERESNSDQLWNEAAIFVIITIHYFVLHSYYFLFFVLLIGE
jgi:hypothetical protein